MQNGSFLPFSLPDIGEEEISEVVEVLRSGWLTTGPKTRRFEQKFADFLGGDVEAVAVNSGTAALHLGLEALGVGSGDEVLVPVFTFTASAEVVRYLGAEPIFADVEESSLNISATGIEPLVSGRTRAVIPVHFGGLTCDMGPILKLAESRGLDVLEDAAHALPATWGKQRVGALRSAATAFSFYATKTLATGEGGMLVTRREEISRRARVMRLHGIDRDAFDRYGSDRPSWYYEVVAPGFKYNMTDLAAAIGLHQLVKIEQMRSRREFIAETYDQAFSDLPLRLPTHTPIGEIHAWHLYVIRLEDGARVGRDQFIDAMAQRGIGASVHFIPLHRHPYWRDRYGLRDEMFPVATRAFESAVSLPLYSKMSDADVERVIGSVREILGGGG
jgi:dTDP-4-amino-4,6-dideoxygalactose transaminase